jgi:hypothetical protein
MNLSEINRENFDMICKTATVLNEAKEMYENQWQLFQIEAERKPMSEDRFWHIVGEYRSLIVYAKNINRVNEPEWAADELLRRSLVERHDISFDEAVHFALNWPLYVQKFYRAADKSGEIKWDLSDDGFGDLMDGLVLCGKDFLNRLQNDDFEGRKHFRREAKDILGDLADMVLDGENYFGMSLESAAKDRFVGYVCRYMDVA